MGGLTGLWLGRFAPERFQGLVVANTAARIGDQAGWLSRARTVRQEGMEVVAAGAADRWFTHAFRQKTPEVVEALCHQLTHIDAEGYAACCEAAGRRRSAWRGRADCDSGADRRRRK